MSIRKQKEDSSANLTSRQQHQNNATNNQVQNFQLLDTSSNSLAQQPQAQPQNKLTNIQDSNLYKNLT
jgi:hypothetical protein